MSLRRLIFFVAAVPYVAGWSFFDPFHENVEKGNELAEHGEADEALTRYQEAARVDPSSPIPDFNRGIVLSGDGKAADALDAFRAASASDDAALAADALYNMGNVYLDSEELEPAVESYLKSLDLDPADPDAKRNLELALQRLQRQQQQQQQQQEQGDEKEKGDEEEQQQPPDDQPEPDPGEQDEQPQPDEQQSEEEQPQPEPRPDEERLSREDAERLLNAVQSDELKVLEQLNQKPPSQGVVTYDW